MGRPPLHGEKLSNVDKKRRVAARYKIMTMALDEAIEGHHGRHAAQFARIVFERMEKAGVARQKGKTEEE